LKSSKQPSPSPRKDGEQIHDGTRSFRAQRRRSEISRSLMLQREREAHRRFGVCPSFLIGCTFEVCIEN
jgi:hypothetical protein